MKSSEGLHAPSLLMGATDVLEGEAKVFRVREPEDFRLETVLACGSIEETNGLTIIKDGPHEGVYMDGAWSVNPPLSALIDYSIDEIWLVQVFPKRRAQVPMKPAERQDRRDELWQTSLIEHELKIINFVNEHLEALKADNHYRHINVEVIQMERDLPWGATIFNTRTFVEDMIDYGYHQAHRLLERKENSLTRTRPPRD